VDTKQEAKFEFDRWEERYRTGDTPWETGKPSSELCRMMAQENLRPGRAIDLGCGTGANAVWLSQQGFDVTGVDLSDLAIKAARAGAAAANTAVRFIRHNLLEPGDLGGPFAFFFDRGCYHVVRRIDVNRHLQTLESITRPGSTGLVLAGNARERQDPGPPVVTEQEIRNELGRSFAIVWLREFHFDSVGQEGKPFLGWSCFLRRA